MKPFNVLEISRSLLSKLWDTDLTDCGISIPSIMFVKCDRNGRVENWKKAKAYFPQELPFLRNKTKIYFHYNTFNKNYFKVDLSKQEIKKLLQHVY